ncbi:MAG: hypothetical protein QNM02_14455 [Acidimicrobiia bacterium]|nr:hypothetical protein [Acidimicrobiia bacterium]
MCTYWDVIDLVVVAWVNEHVEVGVTGRGRATWGCAGEPQGVELAQAI